MSHRRCHFGREPPPKYSEDSRYKEATFPTTASPPVAQGATSLPVDAKKRPATMRRVNAAWNLCLFNPMQAENALSGHERSNEYLAQAYEQNEKKMRGGDSDQNDAVMSSPCSRMLSEQVEPDTGAAH